AAAIRNREYDYVARLAKELTGAKDSIVRGLIDLGSVLEWLDNPTRDGPPAMDAKTLESLGLTPYVGDCVDAAVARLHLLEGNVRQAAEVLKDLSDSRPDEPRWQYYAASAAVLSGDRDELARCYQRMVESDWQGRWTVACVLLDAAADGVQREGIQSQLDGAPDAFVQIVKARLTMVSCKQPPKVSWEPGNGGLEEDLEALQTLLGCAFHHHDHDAVERLVALPLFHRLPLASRTMWHGLRGICFGKSIHGRTLLEEAALKLGSRRAALILAVHLLELGHVCEGKRFLERAAAGRADNKVLLLRAYIAACEKNTDSACEEYERLAVAGEPHAQYALGNLYLHHACEARRGGQNDRAQMYCEQAIGALDGAMHAGAEAIPSDCRILRCCARFMADPQRQARALSDMWEEIQHLEPSRRRSWIVWNAVLARLWCRDVATYAAVCETASGLLQDSIANIDPGRCVEIAHVAAAAAVAARDPDSTAPLVQLLEELSKRSALVAVGQLRRLVASHLARQRHTAIAEKDRDRASQWVKRLAKSDCENTGVGLLATSVCLADGDREGAITRLQ
ncbi:hypothetical protein LCGC14_2323590, partial [marine sediment metagenome]